MPLMCLWAWAPPIVTIRLTIQHGLQTSSDVFPAAPFGCFCKHVLWTVNPSAFNHAPESAGACPHTPSVSVSPLAPQTLQVCVIQACATAARGGEAHGVHTHPASYSARLFNGWGEMGSDKMDKVRWAVTRWMRWDGQWQDGWGEMGSDKMDKVRWAVTRWMRWARQSVTFEGWGWQHRHRPARAVPPSSHPTQLLRAHAASQAWHALQAYGMAPKHMACQARGSCQVST